MSEVRPLRIGVLALQGGVVEHIAMLRQLGAEPVEVRLPEHLEGLDGIILPGGESTTIGKLMVEFGLLDPLRSRLQAGMPAYGTCAGMILLANDLGASKQPELGVMDIRVRRNAFGSQLDSFEQDLEVAGLDGPMFHAVFIRAPIIERLGGGVEPLALLENGTPVAARQGRLLVSAFHPELGDDPRIHQLFLEMCAATVAA
ncbi:MAG: pyridoxal 5-phosphate synthase glutaminase subunit PdxT [Chloroflexi bacterium]|jgi:5'-phosphate synthase pdxT subunit|nr:pyridoxal 5-phosphate synthase glutaminase subunit PdxT [Chloroflexota bacterium]